MPDLYTAIPGGMPTGWLRKISLLEKQMAEAQRDLALLKRQVQKLDEPKEHVATLFETYAPEAPPVKRGPGRPRKNP